MMKEMADMLEIKNLTKVLADKLVLKNITLTLNKGEVLAVIGPNGAGKSTFFKCVVGLLQPSSGDTSFAGRQLTKKSLIAKRKIGFLGHESYLYSSLSSVENLLFYGKLYKVNHLEEKIPLLLKEVGLHLFKDVPIRSFSRGMIQRLSIARVLLSEPEILMLDEPHTGLDQEAVALLNRIILSKKAAGISIILISHDFEQVHKLADRVAVLKSGRIIDTLTMGEESNLYEMKEWYEKVVTEG